MRSQERHANCKGLTELGHAEGAHQLQRVQLWQVLLVVLGGAQVADGAAAQREVHAGLDGQGVVAVEQGLEAGDELARVCGRLCRSAGAGSCSQGDGSGGRKL